MNRRKDLLQKTICFFLSAVIAGTGFLDMPATRNGWHLAEAAWESTVLLIPGAERSLILIDESKELSTDEMYDLLEKQSMFPEKLSETLPESQEWSQIQQEQWILEARRDYYQNLALSINAGREQAQKESYEAYLKEKARQEEIKRQQEEEIRKKQEAEEEAKRQAAKAEAEKKGIYCVVTYTNGKSITITKEDYQCLLRIVEAEAGGEDSLGKRLVANVVLNRVASAAFPKTVVGVVFQKGQFSPIRDGAYNRAKPSKDTIAAVKRVLESGADESCGALYFFARSLTTKDKANWFDTALTKVYQHGVHEFYK